MNPSRPAILRSAALAATALAWSAALTAASAAEPAKPAAPSTAATPARFADEVLVKGKNLKVTRSQLDTAILQFKANLTARGQALPPDRREQVEAQLLDRLVVTAVLVSLADEKERADAQKLAADFIAETRKAAGSEEAFKRQLLAMNFSEAEFGAQVLERAICEEVIDREIKSKVQITDEVMKQYYDANPDTFQRPEYVKAAHILFGTKEPTTGIDLTPEQKAAKKELAEKILKRAQAGEDFAALATAYSEDPGSKDRGGEYTFPRGQMVPEFEKAAFSMKTNQVSDLVVTKYGFHIIKLYEKHDAETLTLEKVKPELKTQLTQREMEKMLPNFLETQKKQAGLEYLNGAKPPARPEESTTGAPASK